MWKNVDGHITTINNVEVKEMKGVCVLKEFGAHFLTIKIGNKTTKVANSKGW